MSEIADLRPDLQARQRAIPIRRTRVCPDGDPYLPHPSSCTCAGTGLWAKPAPTAAALALGAEPIPEGDPRGERETFVEGFDS